ncbi:cytochrome P450 [Streptomyces sp. NPDC056534]|uniref:cytochrome P450 n=1 Tax=Streptomyces sp. NPDC056534 TaxID=3345857 RepID=UPI003679FF20
MKHDINIATAPGALPFLGHFIPLLRSPLDFLRSLSASGGMVHIRLGPVRVIMACDPGIVRQVLRDDRTFDKGGFLFERATEIAGHGLITCPHALHRRQRRMCQPAFTSARLPTYTPAMSTHARAAATAWRDGQSIDVPAEMMTIAARSLTGTMFSGELPPNALQHMLEDVDVIIEGMFRRVITPTMLTRIPLPSHRRYEYALARLRRTLDDVIVGRRSEAADHGDLISRLLAATSDQTGQPLSDKEITDQAITFFIAGVETTASTLSWALHLVAHDPNIMLRLQAEAEAALGGAPATHADLPSLPLTARVITETLRLYPPTWFLTRVTTADTMLDSTIIPSGTTIAFSPYLLHHNPDLYPDPERFDPDRWLAEGARVISRDSYIPFGAGARKCIGDQFALNEAVITLATLTQHWRLWPHPDQRVRAAVGGTIRPRALYLRLQATNLPLK